MSVSLVIGADSRLGRAVSLRERQLGRAVIETRRKSIDSPALLDIASMATTWHVPADVSVAYFCAAVTSQRSCYTDFAAAYSVNVRGTCELVRRLIDAGVFVVFPSTNLVFDGSQAFVSPLAMPCPRTAYGRMKAETEARLLDFGGGVGIVRLSKVVHDELAIFAEWQAAFHSGAIVHPLADVMFSPLPLADASALLVAVAHSRTPGVVQASAAEDLSYAEACFLFARSQGVSSASVRPISWRESGLFFEHVPDHTTLDSTRATALFGFRPPSASVALTEELALSGERCRGNRPMGSPERPPQ